MTATQTKRKTLTLPISGILGGAATHKLAMSLGPKSDNAEDMLAVYWHIRRLHAEAVEEKLPQTRPEGFAAKTRFIGFDLMNLDLPNEPLPTDYLFQQTKKVRGDN